MADQINLLLFFTIQLDESGSLHQGRLNLIDPEVRGILGRWRATSGLAQYQGVGDWQHPGGGVIPATYELVPPIPFYSVDCTPTDLRNLKGVEGNGYAISPFEVTTKNGTARGDFLIHRDANFPGTLGCIGILNEDWADFDKVFRHYTNDMERIGLLISHTY